MAILPVDSRELRGTWGVLSGNRPADGSGFAGLFDASVERARSNGEISEKAAEAAEIMRLEMMKSAVSFSRAGDEPTTMNVGSSLKAFLTHFVDASQKTDTAESKTSLSEEADGVSNGDQAVSPVDAPSLSGAPATRFDAIIRNAANRYGVQEGLIKAVIKMESDFNPKAVSHAGARGLMQLMPSTAAGLGVRDAFDPEQNIMAGTRFLRDLLDKYGGDLDSALAAYNWGPGNVDRSRGAFLPRETREYLVKVKRYYTQFIG